MWNARNTNNEQKNGVPQLLQTGEGVSMSQQIGIALDRPAFCGRDSWKPAHCERYSSSKSGQSEDGFHTVSPARCPASLRRASLPAYRGRCGQASRHGFHSICILFLLKLTRWVNLLC